MTTYEEKLILDNIGLVYDIAWKNYNKFQKYYELDDLRSVGFIGLMNAVQNYNPDLGNVFSTYAYKVISNEIYMYIGKENKHNKEISLYTEISEGVELQDILEVDYNIGEELEKLLSIKELQEAIGKLPDKYEEVIRYHLQGLTHKQIGEKMNLSKSRINTMYNKALNMLRYKLRFMRR